MDLGKILYVDDDKLLTSTFSTLMKVEGFKDVVVYNNYKSLGFPEHYGLYEANVIIRKHNNKSVIDLMEYWWSEILNNSHRDQLSLNYVIWKYDFDNIIHSVKTLDFPPKIHKNIKDA